MQRAFKLPPLCTSLDLLLIFALGALTVSVYGYRWLNSPPPVGQESGLQVVIRLEDEIVGRFALDVDTSFTVTGYLGPTQIETSGGSVRFRNAPCPQKICEKSGPIHSRGSMLVCAPNRLLARIEGSGPPDETRRPLDSVTR